MGINKIIIQSRFFVCIASVVGLMIQCSSMNPANETQTGSLAVKVSFLQATPDISFPTVIRSAINSVEIIVDHAGGQFKQEYAYSLKQATIMGISEGTATVVVNAYDLAKTKIVTGSADQITIKAGQSNDANVQVSPEDPLKPYLLTPTKSGNQISLTWVMFAASPFASFKQFVINRQSQGGGWQQVGTEMNSNARTWIDNNPPAGINSYTVSFMKQDNAVITSNAQSVTATGTGTTSLNPQLNVPTLSGSSVTLTWGFPESEVGRISGFVIQRTTDNGASWQDIGNRTPSNRDYTDANPTNDRSNGYIVAAIETAGAARQPSVAQYIQVGGTNTGTVKLFEGSLVTVTNALIISNRDVWFATDPNNLPGGHSAKIDGGISRDTMLAGTNKIIFHDPTMPLKIWIFLAEPINSQNLMLYNSLPVVTEFVPVANTGYIPYTGTIDMVKNALQASQGEVWVLDAAGNGLQEWVDSVSLENMSVLRNAINVAVMTLRDDRNYKGANPPLTSRRYILFGQPSNRNSLLLNTNSGKTRPTVMWVETFRNLP
jgi:hypothetical protein